MNSGGSSHRNPGQIGKFGCNAVLAVVLSLWLQEVQFIEILVKLGNIGIGNHSFGCCVVSMNSEGLILANASFELKILSWVEFEFWFQTQTQNIFEF